MTKPLEPSRSLTRQEKALHAVLLYAITRGLCEHAIHPEFQGIDALVEARGEDAPKGKSLRFGLQS